MFWMSEKSVPFCLVLIEPKMIGVPVACTPGLSPQAEASDAPPPALALAGDEVADVDPPAAGELEVLELELHPARTPPTARTEARAAASRHLRGAYSFIITCLLVARQKDDSERYLAARE
jgi:hypothetical protein